MLKTVHTRSRTTMRGMGLALVMTAGTPALAAVSFQSLGTSSAVHAVSGDGKTAGGDGFVWTQSGGLSAVAYRVNGISGDGSVLVGRVGSRAVRVIGSTITDLNTFGTGTASSSNAVSGNGVVIVGCAGATADTISFRWTDSLGTKGLSGTGATGGGGETWGARDFGRRFSDCRPRWLW